MASIGGIQKICVICGEDCSDRPRTKDSKGRYYCKQCHEGALQKKQPHSSHSPPVADVMPLDIEIGPASMLDQLVPEHPPASRGPLKMGCPGCGAMIDADAVLCINCGLNVKTNQPLQISAPPIASRPSNRQTLTTVLGIVALSLGGLGLLVSGFLMVINVAARPPGISAGAVYASSIIALTCKLGLIGIGILMLMRQPLALALAGLVFILSVSGTVFEYVMVTRPMLAAIPPTGDPAYDTGRTVGSVVAFALVLAVTAAVYLPIIWHLNRQRTRLEFE